MKFNSKAIVAAFILAGSIVTFAGNTANQNVTIAVSPINELSVSGNPTLTVDSAIAGEDPTPVTAWSTYSVTTNESNRKITARLEQALPPGITLTMNMEAPQGASSTIVPLGTVDIDAVHGITRLSEPKLNVNWELSATAEAGTLPPTVTTVTFTILSED